MEIMTEHVGFINNILILRVREFLVHHTENDLDRMLQWWGILSRFVG